MPVSITQDLNTTNPVRNPVRFGVTSNILLDNAGTLAAFEFTFDVLDMPVDGDTLTLYHDPDNTGNPLLATAMAAWIFKNTPDTSGNQLPVYVSGGINNWVVDDLIPIMEQNYWLLTNFTIELETDGGNYGVKITGRDYDTLTSFMDGGGFGFFSETTTVETARELTVGASIVFQVWVEDGVGSDDYVMASEEVYLVTDDQYAEIDAAGVLRPYLDHYMPPASAFSALNMVNSYTRFFIRAGERYGTPTTYAPMRISDTVYTYLAGRDEVRRIEWPVWTDELNDSGVVQFLTSWPNNAEATAKKVLEDQYEFLCWVQPETASTQVVADIYYEDGTSDLNNVLTTISGATENQLWMAAAGMGNTAIPNYDTTRRVHRYEMRIRRTSDFVTLSEVRHFRVVYDHHEHQRQFFYFNSRGGVDTIMLIGDRSTMPKPDMVTSMRYTNRAEALADAEDTVTTMRTMEAEHQAGTIMVSVDEMEALRELMASERIVERIDGDHWPVAILDTKGPEKDEARDAAFAVVKYRYALNNTAT